MVRLAAFFKNERLFVTPIQSICVLRLSAIGDVCHAVAVVQAIQKFYPKAEVTWVIGKVEASLLQGLPNVRFIVIDKSESLNAYRKLRAQLPETFDVLLHMQVALRANLIAAFIRAKRKIGFSKHLSKELHSFFVNERTFLPANPHVLEGFAAFATAIGVPAFTPTWNMPLSSSEDLWLSRLLNQHNITVKDSILVVSAASSNNERNWLPDRYAAIIDYAYAHHFKVLLCGGPSLSEKQIAQTIIEHCKNKPINIVGETTLKQLLALLKRATALLCPDSGPAHMATTQGTPVIGLYAHSNPARTGPYYSQQFTVETYHQLLLVKTGKTAEQLKWGMRLKGPELMANITVTAVKHQFDKLVQQKNSILLK